MYNNYDYPMGADTPDAPWNEKENEEREFDVIVTQTLVKNEKVFTSDYNYFVEQEEDGGYSEEIETDDTDWEQAWSEQCWSIPELLNKLKKYVEEELATSKNIDKGRKNYLNGIINACQGWNVIETCVEQQ